MSSVLRLIAILCLLLAPALALPDTGSMASDCPVLEATDTAARASLMQYVCYYSAPPGAPGHEARNPDQLPRSIDWTPANGRDLVFSHTKSVYWVHLHVRNSGAERAAWYLKLNYPLLDNVTFWQTGNGVTTNLTTGDQRPFLSRGIDYRYFLLPVTLEAGEVQTITLRVQSSGALNVPLSLETPDTVVAESNHLTLTHGLFYGALLVFAVFNLLLFFSSGTVYYFHNAFYMGTMGLFLFAMGGFANQYFWPESSELANLSIPLTLAVCALAMTLFGWSFLEVGPDTLSVKALKSLATVAVGAVALTLLIPYTKSILINTARGGLINEVELCAALDKGEIAGAALDVVEQEPLSAEHCLTRAANVILSPHTGGSTAQALARTADQVTAQVIDVLTGRKPPHLVNPEVWNRRRQPASIS